MEKQKPTAKDKPRFELWRDRTFSILVPLFFGYLLLTQVHNTTVKIVLVVLLLGFATGEAALFGRHILRFIIKGLGADEEEVKENKVSQPDKDRKLNNTSNNKKDE